MAAVGGTKMMKNDCGANLSNPKAGGCLAAILLIPLQLIHWAIMIPVLIIGAIVAGIAKLFGGGNQK